MFIPNKPFIGGLLICAGLLAACQSAPPVANTPTPNATLTAIFAQSDLDAADSFSTAAAQTATEEAKPNGSLRSTPTLPPLSSPTVNPSPSGNQREATATAIIETTSITGSPVVGTVTLVPPPTIAVIGGGVPIFLDFSPTATAEGDEETEGIIDKTKRAGPGIQAFYLETPPEIDGNLNDFDAPSYALTRVVYGEGYLSGQKDLSGIFQIGWNEDNLYLSAIVFDSKFLQESTGPQLYRGDSIEILLDVNMVADYMDTSISEDDFQLGISPGNLLEGGQPEAFVWAPRILEGALDSATIAAGLTSDGYILEASIPWVSLGATPFEGQHMGFLFSLSDNDDPREAGQQTVVSFAPNRTLHDPTTWYDLWLVKP